MPEVAGNRHRLNDGRQFFVLSGVASDMEILVDGLAVASPASAKYSFLTSSIFKGLGS